MNTPADLSPPIWIPVNAYLVTLRVAERDVAPGWSKTTVDAAFRDAQRLWNQANINLHLCTVEAICVELPMRSVEPIDHRGIDILQSRICQWKREAFNVAFVARTASASRLGGHVPNTRFVVMPYGTGWPTATAGRTLAHEFGHILLGPEHFVPSDAIAPEPALADNLMMQGFRGTRLTSDQIRRAGQFRVY